MKPRLIFAFALAVLAAGGCGRSATTAVDDATLGVDRGPSDAHHRVTHEHVARNFRTHLQGRNEVPPVKTRAQGEAIFHVSDDATEIHYKLIVSNINDITGAHIHMAPKGTNGPVVVGLLSAPPGPGRHQGVLAEGVITAADVVGPLAGDLDALLDRMSNGRAYVNVHTTAHPSGEVRGQIR